MASGRLAQVTNDPTHGSLDPVPDEDGGRIVVRSYADLVGNDAGPGRRAYLADVPTGTFARLTATTWPQVAVPLPSGDGVLFDINTNPVGENADGSYELFLARCASG